jgi:hypothetical protein
VFSHILERLPRKATLVIEARELAAADRSLAYLSSLVYGESP